MLVSNELRALLCDFGLAKALDDEGSSSGFTTSKMPMSTRFASPELAMGDPRDFKSDMWAWACLLLQVYDFTSLTSSSNLEY